MRRGWGHAAGLAVAIMSVATACSAGPDYQYLESDDGHLFGKIPSDWAVEREGAVGYLLIDTEQVQFAFTPGDETQPWSAEFEAPGADGEVPAGQFFAQHIDARWRNTFRLYEWIDGQIEAAQENGLTVVDYEREGIRRDEYIGYRVEYTVEESDIDLHFEEVYLIDDRRSGMYAASVFCSTDCHDEYADDIGEVLLTFTVEP